MSRPKPSKPNRKHKSNAVTLSNLTLHKLDWLEWLTIGLSIWFLLYPKPYKILLGVLLIIPIVGLVLNGLHRPSIASLVEISVDKEGDKKYDVADFIDFAAWVILLRVLLDFEFESFYSMIIPGTIASVIILTILFMTHKMIASSNRNKTWIYLSLIFNISLYSYAGTYAANCAYDRSTPQIYETEVLSKRISRHKRTTYYFKIAPWGHHYDKEEISVPASQYNSVDVGEKIDVVLKDGLFGIPWYYLRNRSTSL